MDFSRWDVMGSTAGFSLMKETLGNIREVAPSTAFERGEPIRLVTGDGPASPDAASAFASGVGSLADASA
jgi:hypothetical protein